MRYGQTHVQDPKPTGRTPLRVGIILADNFTLSAFALFIDHLRLAADEGDRSRPLNVQWSIMASKPDPLRASCGVMTTPTSNFLDPHELDYVVVVGGVLHAGRQIDEATERYLKRVADAGVKLIGMCTGSFILCRIGLMKGRRTCVSWYHYQDFLDEFPDHDVVADRLFLADGDRITCAGGAGTADLASHLIERHIGWSVAQKASQVLLFDRTRGGGEAQPHPPMSEKVSDPRVRRALLLMEQNLARPLPIAHVAEKLALSTRQFERLCHTTLGMSPASAYRHLRLRYAHWLIGNTDRSVTEIAHEAGFADCAHFSRQFKETYGSSPSGQRRRPDHGADDGNLASMRVFS
ncbi:MAG TPA: GlxA family transcriptional regulator [Caulobacteraceae bacterium]|jgi:transcriptional regulator GlxA family with amidase domain